MRIHPSVVIGVGSTGGYVVASLERILYEVMGDAELPLFKLVVIDTDSGPKEDEPPPGGRRSIRFEAHESNTGQAIKNLRHALGRDFEWCPEDLVLDGEGAGNRRAGGRMLLFNRFPEVWRTIQDSVHDACIAAAQGQTRQLFERKFEERRHAAEPDLINPSVPVVYVVGTLAGGTCSGMCVDLGYAIANAAPGAKRIATFFLPARTEAPTYLENTWATLKDLEYFCDNPSSFRSVWKSAAGAKQRYQADNVLPYDVVYLLSTTDETGALKMRYAPNSQAPLVHMSALQLACALLGMEHDISTKHVDAYEQIRCKQKNRFFYNYNVRAVMYPKYDLSEAAACRIVERAICGAWLSEEGYQTAAGARTLNPDDIRGQGRKLWNTRFESIWEGMVHAVDLNAWVDRILRGDSAESELFFQFTDPAPNTIYSQVYQTLVSRRTELQKMIREGLGKAYSDNQNLRYGELYIEGLRAEMQHTERFWDLLGTPSRTDSSAWSGVSRTLVHAALSTRSTSARALGARRDLLFDELRKALTRLQMYLMKQVVAELQVWMEGELATWMRSLRETIQAVQGLAASRASTLASQLDERVGPLLKISRSKTETLREEMEKLAQEPVRPLLTLLSTVSGEFQGEFAVKTRRDPADDRKIFLKLKGDLQPRLLQKLEEYGRIDVAAEIKSQGRAPQVADHYREAQAMSVTTSIGLVKSPARVPSFLMASDTRTGEDLKEELRTPLGRSPEMVAKPLPLLDHMAVFYQEGACSVEPDAEYHSFPEVLSDAPVYREHYEIRMKDRPDILDPLRSMKGGSAAAAGGNQ